jgi:hypothetical protein
MTRRISDKDFTARRLVVELTEPGLKVDGHKKSRLGPHPPATFTLKGSMDRHTAAPLSDNPSVPYVGLGRDVWSNSVFRH